MMECIQELYCGDYGVSRRSGGAVVRAGKG
jgi:hypothetical protein